MKKGNYKRTPEHIIKQIVDLYNSGLNKTDISKELNISISVICSYTPAVRRHMDDYDKAYISKLYALGKTQIEIGEIIGFSRDTVARVTKTLPKRKKPHRQVFKPKVIKPKKLKPVIKKEKPNNAGKEVNTIKLVTKERPPVYKKIRLDNRTEIETYSVDEYESKLLKYGI